MSQIAPRLENLEELRKRKKVFDNTWVLAIVLSAFSIMVFWYLGLGQVDTAPIIWTLALLAAVQLISNSRTATCTTAAQLRTLAQTSEVAGIGLMAVAWHLFGGLQQPMFPLFIMLPLFSGALILSFWQQQSAIILFLGVLLSGVLLSPDTNSFIEERYGLGAFSTHVLPDWMPRSRVAFLDVSTSPAYNLMLTLSLAILAVALTAVARAIVALSWRSVDSIETLRAEVDEARQLSASMVENAPASEVLLSLSTGRILIASRRFVDFFGVGEPAAGQFLLDTVAFAYPAVIKRLMAAGGEEIQGATVRGRDVMLRVSAGTIGTSPMVRLSIEPCDDICWRGAVDTLETPAFAVNSRGRVIFLNRSAAAVFGAGTEGSEAALLFDKNPGSNRWWDIAPLESTRRMLQRGARIYLVTICRERVAQSIDELSFVHLTERESIRASALS